MYVIFCVLAILVTASTLEVNNGTNDIDLSVIPTFLSDGMNGTGHWLTGILDQDGDVVDSIISKTTFEDYKNGLLNVNSDATLSFAELAAKYGYPVEEYEVKSDDGYLLTVFRIPYGANSPMDGVTRPVVFLMHGLIDCSDDWIILGPKKSLGYILADAGYDVWFGNSRGNTYSKKHISKKSSDFNFWEFSWDEIGRFDLPAMIDFALEKTGEKNLFYIGHSQGTTSFFVMTSMRPEYNDKIRVMYALAPIAFMSHMNSPLIKLISPWTSNLDWIMESLGKGEFLPSNSLLMTAGGVLCRDRAITQTICYNPMFIVCGFDLEQMNATMLPVLMGHVPAGSSIRQFLHYGQGVVSKAFRRYDFGYTKNLLQYGYISPPDYDLSKISAPVYLFYSQNDWLSHPKDVHELGYKLGNLAGKYLVPIDMFNHMDYMWAIDIDKLVNHVIIRSMKNH